MQSSKSSPRIRVVAVMLSKPKLVQRQIDQDLASHMAPKPAVKPKPTSNKGNAKFLMGLNNRVAKLDERLSQLEASFQEDRKSRIGYRELGLTLALALLLFTSTALVMREPNTAFEEKLLSAITGAKTPEEEIRSATWIQAITNHPTLVAWSESILGSAESHQSSNLSWPLEKQPNYRNLNYANHKQGLLLNAKLGDPVVAIDSGKVVYSGNGINGYGNLILIEHSDDLISVYGNNYSNYVKEGQNVRKGELIASVGESTGNIPRLYFELRHKGEAQDPFLYFK